MALWLKHRADDASGTYTVEQINVIPTGVQAPAIVSGILAANLCMVYPLWAVLSAVVGVLLFSNVCLLVWDVPLGLHFFAYYALGMTSCVTPILFPWVNIVMKDDNEARSFTTGAMVSSPFSFLFLFFFSFFSFYLLTHQPNIIHLLYYYLPITELTN